VVATSGTARNHRVAASAGALAGTPAFAQDKIDANAAASGCCVVTGAALQFSADWDPQFPLHPAGSDRQSLLLGRLVVWGTVSWHARRQRTWLKMAPRHIADCLPPVPPIVLWESYQDTCWGTFKKQQVAGRGRMRGAVPSAAGTSFLSGGAVGGYRCEEGKRRSWNFK
jgi:hypothetical protein